MLLFAEQFMQQNEYKYDERNSALYRWGVKRNAKTSAVLFRLVKENQQQQQQNIAYYILYVQLNFLFFRKGKLRSAYTHTLPSTYQCMLVTLLLKCDKSNRRKQNKKERKRGNWNSFGGAYSKLKRKLSSRTFKSDRSYSFNVLQFGHFFWSWSATELSIHPRMLAIIAIDFEIEKPIQIFPGYERLFVAVSYVLVYMWQ